MLVLLAIIMATWFGQTSAASPLRNLLIGKPVPQPTLDVHNMTKRSQEIAFFVLDQKTRQEQTPYFLYSIRNYSVQLDDLGVTHLLEMEIGTLQSDWRVEITVRQTPYNQLKLVKYEIVN